MNKKRLIIIIILFIFVLLSIVGFKYLRQDNKKDKYIEEEITLNFESRLDKMNNFEYEGYFTSEWLQVQGTNIDMPVLSPTFEVEVRNGNIKPDIDYSWYNPNYKPNENRRVFMGHNILNVSSNPLRNNPDLRDFEPLLEFVYYDFAKDNLYIQYTYDGVEEIYLIYAISFYNYADDDGSSISNKKDIEKYIINAKKDSIYDYNVDVDSSDELISLMTCSRFFGSDYRNQFRIDARKLRKNEKTKLYNVVVNENYKDIQDKLSEETL